MLPPRDQHLRLALVTETYPPELNGAAKTLARLVAGLAERGHEVEVVRPRQMPADKGRRAATGTERLVLALPLLFYRGLRLGAPAVGTLRRSWQARRPDVVHIATEGPLGLAALWVAQQLSIPVCSSFHTNFHLYAQHYGLGWLRRPALAYLRWFHNAAGRTLVPTSRLAHALTSDGFARLGLLPRGVDAGLFTPARRDASLRAAWGASERDPVALYVGRLAAEKNLSLVVESFMAIRAAHARARFVLVGDGPLAGALRQSHPDFVFPGRLDGERLATHYASADAFIFPSLTETFGNVTLEAMASGLGVVAFDDAAASELIDPGRNGLLVRRGDRRAFVEAAVWVGADLEQARRLGQFAARSVGAFTWEAVTAGLERVLLELAQQPRLP
jgi:glycosyltransferase involved in cell wall biosynthesis